MPAYAAEELLPELAPPEELPFDTACALPDELLPDALPEPFPDPDPVLPPEALPEPEPPEEPPEPELAEELPEPLPEAEPPELFPEPEPLPDDPPRSMVVLPAPLSSTSSSLEPELPLPILDVFSPTSTLILPPPEVSELSSSSSLLSEELPPSRLENGYPADAANVSAAELLYPVIESGDHPDCEPIEVTERGIVIELIPLPENAPLSIVVRLPGNDKDVTLLHPARAPLPMILVLEFKDTLDLPTGTIINLVSEALYRHPPSDAYAELPEATLIVDRLEQPDSALPPILVVLAGIEIADRLEQFANALSPILVTPDGIDIELKPEQPENAPLPMLLTLAEIAILDSERHPLNVEAGIDEIEACRLTELSPLHPANTPLPILVTLPGIVTFDNDVQFANALSPILVTLPGMLTLLIALPENAPAPMDVTSEGIVTAPPPPLYAVNTPPEMVISAVFEANTFSHGIRNNTIANTINMAGHFFLFELFICVTPSSL